LPSLSSLLLRIPDEFKPLAALGIGAVILVFLVLFHGLGIHRILVHYKHVDVRLRSGRPHLGRAAFLFIWAIFMMLSLHICEIVMWAYALIWLGLIVRPADAIYFCANAYTTLGYGTVDLGASWRNISPIIAISGLFTFAWTTSSLVNLVAGYLKLVEQLETERLEQLRLRASAAKAEWDVLADERQAERAERREADKRAGGVSFFERRTIRKEEKQKLKQMRELEKTERENIREKERSEEDKLGPGAPPGDAGVKK
jgi:hypothetical protein